MKALIEYPLLRGDRHASVLAHDEPNCRIVKFTLDAAQQVAVHTSASTVVVTVESGSGTLIGGDSQMQVTPGDTVVYAPNEPHGMIAGENGLRFVAVIAPSP